MIMKCPCNGHNCNEPKIYHITLSENNEIKHDSCCSLCLDKFLLKQDTPPAPKKLAELVADFALEFMNAISAFQKPILSETGENVCPKCHCSLMDIEIKQRLGCPECYHHFGSSILKILTTYHGAVKHIGKVPKNRKIVKSKSLDWGDITRDRIEKNIALIEIKLKNAIKLENYEKANDYKILLSSLKQSLTDMEDADKKNDFALRDQIVNIITNCEYSLNNT